MNKNTLTRWITIAVTITLAILFVAKFAGPNILRFYIESGIGTCKKIPILCMAPADKIISPDIDKIYVAELRPYRFPKMEIYLPKGFTLVQETVKKVYYKRKKRPDLGSIAYVLYEEPGFFINLFPLLKKRDIKDNYEFIRRTMYANLNNIRSLSDAFFVIVKGIFIPDLGNQKNVMMREFRVSDKRGFINYNLGQTNNYFDCNVIDDNGAFFKIYIKDRSAALDLDKVLAIISMLNSY